MTTELEEPVAPSPIGVADATATAAAAAAAAAAASSSPVAYFRDALPPRLLAALRADAEGLACCSNFWIPRAVLSGEEPALAAFEQAAAELAQRCLSRRSRRRSRGRRWREKEEEPHTPELSPPPRLHPLISVYKESGSEGEEKEEVEEQQEQELVVSGAECWCQLYEKGRGLDPHYDKDEEASARGERPLRHPRVSTVVYLNGSEGGEGEEEDGGGKKKKKFNHFGATVVINQRLHPRSGAPLPAVPTSSALLWPRRGAAAAFDGRLAHCVLSSSSSSGEDKDGGDDCDGDDGDNDGDASAAAGAEKGSSTFDEGKRATVLFNFWCGPSPGGVLRVTEEDIVAAGLSRPVGEEEAEEEEGGSDGGGSTEPTPVPPAAVAVPSAAAAASSALCLLDDLLRPRGALDHPFVVVSHPGFELVEAEVQQQEEGARRGEQEEDEEEEEEKTAAAPSKSQIVFIPVSSDSEDSD